MNRKNTVTDANYWYLFAGCTLVGLGIGMASGAAGSGLIIGAGIGFLAMVAASYLTR